VTILVTGGAGYIGSHTARVLRKHGYEALLYDNLSTGNKSFANGFELIVGDIADSDRLAAAMRRVDGVMHFAAHAYVGESVQNPRKYFRNNVEAALVLLNTALDCGVRKFVFSSTCAVYGSPPSMPLAEDARCHPINPYGVSKLFFENALQAYDSAYSLRFASLRYFNAAGADESGEIGELHDPETHLIPLALEASAGTGREVQVYGSDYPTPDGTCVRDYIHVNDLAEAHVKALQHLLDGGKSFTVNLGTGHGYSVREILTAVESVTGNVVPSCAGPRRPGDPPTLIADPARAQQLLQWKSTRSLADIVASAWNWMERRSTIQQAASLK
jgi:UDP-glucose-4-epimerase GalE